MSKLKIVIGLTVLSLSQHAEATAETWALKFAQAGMDLSRMRPQSDPVRPTQSPPGQTQRTPDYFGPTWSGLQPEQKFGAFVEAFWSFARQSTGSVDCPPGDPRGIKACLAQGGFRFESAYPGDCKVTFREYVPKPANVETTWDGKVAGSFALARSLTIDLHSLKQSLINTSFRLYFDMKNPGSVERAVILSSDPNRWLTIPAPPSLSEMPPGQNEKDRIRAWQQAKMRWGQEALQKYGSNNNLPYFSYFDLIGDDPGNSPELRDPNNQFYRLSPPNLMQPVALFSGNGAQNAQALFIDALKSVIAKCQ